MKLEQLARELDAFLAELEREAKKPCQGTAGLAALVGKWEKLKHELERLIKP